MSPTPPKRKFNPKYHVLTPPEYRSRKEELEKMANTVVYTGNPKHKKNPGDFGLVPPADPRPNASLCDNARIFSKTEAQKLLREAFRFGLVDSRSNPGEWPKIVWMVIHGKMVLQGMYENDPGHYHGFPLLPGDDPICKEVMRAWENRQ